MLNNIDHPELDLSKMNTDNTVFRQFSKAGGTSFLNNISIRKGDPAESKKISQLEHIRDQARKWQWQFRVTMAFREYKRHTALWITLTYRQKDLPADWIGVRRHKHNWLRQLRRFNSRVIVPAGRYNFDRNPDEKMHYIIVEEEGSLNDRKHLHAIVWFPYAVKATVTAEPLIKWKYGYQTVKSVYSGPGLSQYITKYLLKNDGRTTCNLKLGLMTTITLLSLFSFKKLMIMDLTTGQKLLRRLLLTHNYPTSDKLNSLISLHKPLAISRPMKPHKDQPQTGPLTTEKCVDNAGTSHSHISSPANRSARRSTIRHIIKEIRSPENGRLAESLPGLASFGKVGTTSWKTRLATHKNSRLWFLHSNHPRCARNRTRRASLRME